MNKTLTVVGLGHIGLPLALSFCEKGYSVYGIDVDADKIEQLKRGQTDIVEPYEGRTLQAILNDHIRSGRLKPTTRLADASVDTAAYVVTVGLPVTDEQVATAPLERAMADVGRVLKPGDLVLIRSTLPPGTMERLCIPRLAEESRLRPGEEFAVAYAAERVAEGRAMYEFQSLDVVVGGYTRTCTERAAALLSDLTNGSVHWTNLRTAEAVKVVENVQRDVQIAMVQELAQFSAWHGIDVHELIRLANTHPRVKLLTPGIGVGGFCIPNALHYLRHSLPEGEPELPLLRLARRINATNPARVADGIVKQLAAAGVPAEQSTIAVFGLGMKDNSNDLRESPSLALIAELQRRGAVVRAFDPVVPLQFPFQTRTLVECIQDCHALVMACWQDALLDHGLSEGLELPNTCQVLYDPRQLLTPHLLRCDQHGTALGRLLEVAMQ
ncbi:NDP-sugar dehydrogenase [Alicyclobacillus contaminans]|uniref:nucleotide sugar dehydrogenase n=1 Tax=Alicyclobacillus contaminans TaxID=392016 RepID=UPI000414D85A|nr:nucleotide sugar dehydrogenase [Alicyclobacillus contaminans]GMA51894.1 NDP-sugar dehydrogenase [Alicyclobacillus contaminans]